ncbi:MAG TPA: M1 family metallopeptidase [Candidatus Saccharimonadales bacterium]|nr:M1 family metallopeptidase [Candidatus Saccharimonadales bacterium]
MRRAVCVFALLLAAAVVRPAPCGAAAPPLEPPGMLPDAEKGTLLRLARPYAAQAESLHDYDVLHYRLDLDFPCSAANLSGTCAITLRCRVPTLSTVSLDCVSLNVDGVQQDGAAAGSSLAAGHLAIQLPHPLAAGDSTVLTVTYHGPAVAGYQVASPETWYTFSEPSNARYWFPSYDQPWDKATSEIHATVPDTMVVASNGVQTAAPTVNSAAHKKTYHWATNYPITTYLMSVAIGHYVQLTDSAAYVPIRSYVLQADSANAVYDFGNLPDMINYFGSLWGQYPFENYGMAATKDFGGGMENQTRTLITRWWLTGTRSYEWAIAHELAHQWWGDMTTCFTWNDIWVNEGFASYGDILYDFHKYGTPHALERLQQWAQVYFHEESTYSYPLYAPPANKVFGITIYYKGAWALHMLRRVMGDSAFIGGWRDYGRANKYASGSVADFQAAMEARYGGSLAWFFDPWVYGRGHPVLRLTCGATPRAAGGYYDNVTLEQLQTGRPVFQMPVDLVLHAGGHDTLVTVWMGRTGPRSTTQFTLAAPVDSVTVDPSGWLLYLRVPGSSASGAGGPPGRPALRITAVRSGRGVTEVEFEVPQGDPARGARLELFDVLGRRVATLWRGNGASGTFRVRWGGALGEGAGSVSLDSLAASAAPTGPAASGMYFARLTGGAPAASAKVLWLR